MYDFKFTKSGDSLHPISHFRFSHFLNWLKKNFLISGTGAKDFFDQYRTIRFFHDPSLSFDATELQIAFLSPSHPSSTIPFDSNPHTIHIWTSFLGFTGAVTPLPHFFSEEILHTDPEDSPLFDFTNIFHHRALSIFCRFLDLNQLEMNFSSSKMDHWTKRLLSIGGIEADLLTTSETPQFLLALRILPLLTTNSGSKHGIERSLQVIFSKLLPQVELHVFEYTGSWVSLSKSRTSVLGKYCCTLGDSCFLGKRVLDPNSGFTIRMTHLSVSDYARLRQGNDLCYLLQKWLERLLPEAFDVTLALHIEKAAPMHLQTPVFCSQESSAQDSSKGKIAPLLGQFSWLGPNAGHPIVEFSMN